MISPPTHYYGFWEGDPKRWERCRKEAAAQMIAAGWNTKARKFDEVLRRRARKLWDKGERPQTPAKPRQS